MLEVHIVSFGKITIHGQVARRLPVTQVRRVNKTHLPAFLGKSAAADRLVLSVHEVVASMSSEYTPGRSKVLFAATAQTRRVPSYTGGTVNRGHLLFHALRLAGAPLHSLSRGNLLAESA
jgi:hypothetical protein